MFRKRFQRLNLLRRDRKPVSRARASPPTGNSSSDETPTAPAPIHPAASPSRKLERLQPGLQHPARGRPMDVQRVFHARVARRDHDWLVVHRKSDVADQSLVENLKDRFGIVSTAIGQSLDLRTLCWLEFAHPIRLGCPPKGHKSQSGLPRGCRIRRSFSCLKNLIARFSISCYSKQQRYDATGTSAARYLKLSLGNLLTTVVDCCYPIRFIGTPDLAAAYFRLSLNRKIHRIRDEAFRVSRMMQFPRFLHISARRERYAWMQHHSHEAAGSVRRFFHHPFGMIDVRHHSNSASEHKCRYQSLWHADNEATNNSSGFQRVASPRKFGSDDPAIVGFWAPADISCRRS